MDAIRVTHLTKRYGDVLAVDDIDFAVPAGATLGLLGGNGAGKTTTLKAISGLLAVEHGKVTDGQIRFEGEDISNADPVNLFRRGVVQVLEGRTCPMIDVLQVIINGL